MRPTELCFIFALAAIACVGGMPRPHQRRARDALQQEYQCTTLEQYVGFESNESYLEYGMQPRSSCLEWKETISTSGAAFLVSPTGGCEFLVYCDMCLNNEEGWIVIQRRRNGTFAFQDKGWEDYRKGFGDIFGDYWLGLEKIHEITSSGNYELYVGYFRDSLISAMRRAIYTGFSVGSEATNYKLTYTAYDDSRSDAADGLDRYQNREFTTHDSDNDNNPTANCAKHGGYLYGGWWFGHKDDESNHSSDEAACFESNLNGQYYPPPTSQNPNGIKWTSAGSDDTVLADTIIAIRRVPTYTEL